MGDRYLNQCWARELVACASVWQIIINNKYQLNKDDDEWTMNFNQIKSKIKQSIIICMLGVSFATKRSMRFVCQKRNAFRKNNEMNMAVMKIKFEINN